MGLDRAGWRAMCALSRANLRCTIKRLCCAAQLPWDPEAIPMIESKPSESAAAKSAAPWHIPITVEEAAETGQHFDLVADAPVRAAVAKMAGLRDLPRFEANFDVTRRGSGLHVVGSISATVGQ